MGALHGLAGAAPAVALLQITRFNTVGHGLAYLICFAAGTALGMAVYALAAGLIMSRAAQHSERWARRLGQATGLVSVVIGFYWLVR